jgi:hypothetical protein
MGDREERGQKTEDRGQEEKDCRGAVADPPVLYHTDSSQQIEGRQHNHQF